MGCRGHGSTHHHQRATWKETTRKGHVPGVICMHGTRIVSGTPRADGPEVGCMSWHPSGHSAPVALRQGSLMH